MEAIVTRETKVAFSVGVLAMFIPVIISGIGYFFYVRTTLEYNIKAISVNAAKDKEQDTLISQGREMIVELKTQTKALQDGLNKLDERAYRARGR